MHSRVSHGLSQKMTFGRAASSREIATCRSWPPDSAAGRWHARSARPTRRMTATGHRGPSSEGRGGRLRRRLPSGRWHAGSALLFNLGCPASWATRCAAAGRAASLTRRANARRRGSRPADRPGRDLAVGRSTRTLDGIGRRGGQPLLRPPPGSMTATSGESGAGSFPLLRTPDTAPDLRALQLDQIH